MSEVKYKPYTVLVDTKWTLLCGGTGKRIVKNGVRSILSDGLDYIYCIANANTRELTRGIMYGANPYHNKR